MLHMIINMEGGCRVEELRIKPLSRAVISPGGRQPLLQLLDDHDRAMPLKLKDIQIRSKAGGVAIEASWAPEAAMAPEVRLNFRCADEGTCRLTVALSNPNEATWRGSLIFPSLLGCRIAEESSDRWYLLGTRSTILDNAPIHIGKPYSGAFPLQLIDLFAPVSGGGLALLMPDADLTGKTFRFRQEADGAALSVLFDKLTVASGQTLTLPAAQLMPHLGDWHEPFDVYRRTMRTLAKPDREPRLADLFYCRRDYPVSGTGYLFDSGAKRYTLDVLIAESTRSFGGLDMIDISGWAIHNATGRVGDYRTNDLGGLTELKRAIAVAHQKGIKVGLYFEGYLIDKRAPLAQKALPAWQMVGKDGKPRWWPGDMEFFACPGHAPWREELSSAIADVAAAVEPDAVYVDEFGFGDDVHVCWSPHHGHAVPSNPLQEEAKMLRLIRQKLEERSPKVGIYIEQVPCDAMIPLVDGAFNYGMYRNPLPQHPTRLPLHRFVYPELAHIEMVAHGLRPIGINQDDLHRCVFSGAGVWLKGRSESWFSEGFRQTARRAREIFQKYGSVFHSADCDPLIATLQPELYANRFATADAILITVYNAGYEDRSGELLATPIPAGWTAYDLWEDHAAKFAIHEGSVVLKGQIEPRSVGVFVLRPAGK